MITPIIISGGSGTRLWPISRKLQPKQFISIDNDTTLFQDTILRLPKETQDPIIICNEDHRFLAAEQLREINKLSIKLLSFPYYMYPKTIMPLSINIPFMPSHTVSKKQLS